MLNRVYSCIHTHALSVLLSLTLCNIKATSLELDLSFVCLHFLSVLILKAHDNANAKRLSSNVSQVSPASPAGTPGMATALRSLGGYRILEKHFASALHASNILAIQAHPKIEPHFS